MDKIKRLRELANTRRDMRWKGYLNIHDFHNGVYDCDFISPYTKSACNIESEIFILLQDWASENFLRSEVDKTLIRLGHDPNLPTNRHLKELLKLHFSLSLDKVYATNLFPFVKPAHMNAKIPIKDLVRAAKCFALPQIEIIRPRLVVALGLDTFNAIRRANGHKLFSTISPAIASPLDVDGTRIWCQAHTGVLGRNNRNRGDQTRVDSDWAHMSSWYTSEEIPVVVGRAVSARHSTE